MVEQLLLVFVHLMHSQTVESAICVAKRDSGPLPGALALAFSVLTQDELSDHKPSQHLVQFLHEQTALNNREHRH